MSTTTPSAAARITDTVLRYVITDIEYAALRCRISLRNMLSKDNKTKKAASVSFLRHSAIRRKAVIQTIHQRGVAQRLVRHIPELLAGKN